ncbi:MAG: DUF5302 domain-containing protein [Microbacteriaceae bacterium]
MNAEEETPTGASDDTKRRFREALERKQQRTRSGTDTQGTGQSSIHGTHGPADHQKRFRRKSG